MAKAFKKTCEREGCGVEFTARPSEYRKYCSKECATIRWSESAHEKHAKKCANPECSVEFLYPPSSIQKYCSRKCSAQDIKRLNREEKERFAREGHPLWLRQIFEKAKNITCEGKGYD